MFVHDIMTSLGKRISNVPKVEPRSLLPSSIDVTRGSTLGFNNEDQSAEALVEQLAKLIIKVYLYEKRNTK